MTVFPGAALSLLLQTLNEEKEQERRYEELGANQRKAIQKKLNQFPTKTTIMGEADPRYQLKTIAEWQGAFPPESS